MFVACSVWIQKRDPIRNNSACARRSHLIMFSHLVSFKILSIFPTLIHCPCTPYWDWCFYNSIIATRYFPQWMIVLSERKHVSGDHHDFIPFLASRNFMIYTLHSPAQWHLTQCAFTVMQVWISDIWISHIWISRIAAVVFKRYCLAFVLYRCRLTPNLF